MRDIETLDMLLSLADIKNTINRINHILSAYYFDSNQARNIIDEVNFKHPENIMVYAIANEWGNCSGGGVNLSEARAKELRQDLEWKKFYLNGKVAGKVMNKIIDEYHDWQNKRR